MAERKRRAKMTDPRQRDAAGDSGPEDLPDEPGLGDDDQDVGFDDRLLTEGELDDEIREELGVDNIVGPVEAGIGGGLDEQEEALLGLTDEEIARRSRGR